MIIMLVDPRMQFVVPVVANTHILHATETGTRTLCGVAILTAAWLLPNRAMASDQLCKTCCRKLRAYGPETVMVEAVS